MRWPAGRWVGGMLCRRERGAIGLGSSRAGRAASCIVSAGSCWSRRVHMVWCGVVCVGGGNVGIGSQ